MTRIWLVILLALALSGCQYLYALTDQTAKAIGYTIVESDYCKLPEAERLKFRDQVNTYAASRWEGKGKPPPPPSAAVTCP